MKAIGLEGTRLSAIGEFATVVLARAEGPLKEVSAAPKPSCLPLSWGEAMEAVIIRNDGDRIFSDGVKIDIPGAKDDYTSSMTANAWWTLIP